MVLEQLLFIEFIVFVVKIIVRIFFVVEIVLGVVFKVEEYFYFIIKVFIRVFWWKCLIVFVLECFVHLFGIVGSIRMISWFVGDLVVEEYLEVIQFLFDWLLEHYLGSFFNFVKVHLVGYLYFEQDIVLIRE